MFRDQSEDYVISDWWLVISGQLMVDDQEP